MDNYDLYKDIQARTNGEIYIGIVGPVRTGKSTFIKRFMDLMVLPHITDPHQKRRAIDELPQSASGKTIMTTEPKFVPKEAACWQIDEEISIKVRLIDCVGYMVKGAAGYIEEGKERLVKTPWFQEDIPFTKAAAIGTGKVICEHSTVGIVITTDGTIGEIEREAYIQPEEKTIQKLKEIGKPFILLLNSKRPYSKETIALAEQLKKQYEVETLAVNCEQLKESEIHTIMKKILYEFPVSEVHYYTPKWIDMLPAGHKIREDLMLHIREITNRICRMKDAMEPLEAVDSEYITKINVEKIEMASGIITMKIDMKEEYYYQLLSELTGASITGEYQLIAQLKKLSKMQKEYEKIKDALAAVKGKGYGVVTPQKEEILLEEPVVIRQGNKYGVRIHSKAPSIHLIRADIETEIAPIVGNEQQAEDLKCYIENGMHSEEGIWSTNIFGKSVEDLIVDGMRNKMEMINEESQEKLQDTMRKIVNESNGGLVCIII